MISLFTLIKIQLRIENCHKVSNQLVSGLNLNLFSGVNYWPSNRFSSVGKAILLLPFFSPRNKRGNSKCKTVLQWDGQSCTKKEALKEEEEEASNCVGSNYAARVWLKPGVELKMRHFSSSWRSFRPRNSGPRIPELIPYEIDSGRKNAAGHLSYKLRPRSRPSGSHRYIFSSMASSSGTQN